ncbi:MAG: imidazoleglycerol-phosphate dehydratase HisB [Zetaproteobacteria bacterium]|nr:MAG: imidazoleglycerol-phosphate dehydratase HisB [Zetaproteobacteria bacterium]
MKRNTVVERVTKETDIRVELNLDGTGSAELDTGLPFFDHMLEQIARHGLIDLNIRAKGDLEIDAHHTVEDVGICIGEALRDAIGDKAGIMRYGYAYVPLDEALSRVVLDLSGRPGLEYHVSFPKDRVGDFDVDLFKEFFQAVCNHGRITLHIDALRGANNHHIIETVFKAFGRALRQAISIDPRQPGIPSTKGAL